MANIKTGSKTSTRYLTISQEIFLSPMEALDPSNRGELWTRDKFSYGAEQEVFKDLDKLFGAKNLKDPNILWVTLRLGRVFTPSLQKVEGGIGLVFGANTLLLTADDSRGLSLGESKVTVLESTKTVKDETNKEVSIPVLKIVCERTVGDERLRMEFTSWLVEGADTADVADLLRSGELEEAKAFFSTPGTGAGLFLDGAMLAQSFDVAGVKDLPTLAIPIKGYALKEFMWTDPTGKQVPIRSVNLTIDREHLPSVALIKWKDEFGNKRDFKVSGESLQGLQFNSSSNAYRFFNQNEEAELAALIAKGELLLKIFAYGNQSRKHTPLHAMTKGKAFPTVDYSSLTEEVFSEYPTLPSSKDTPASTPVPVVAATPASTPVPVVVDEDELEV
jgi:hypothetical protein